MQSKISLLFTALLMMSLCLPLQANAAPWVKTSAGTLLTDYNQTGVYQPFYIQSVGYSPTPIGRQPSDWGWPVSNPPDPRPANMYDDPAILERDFTLLENMHANAIRIWKGNNTTTSGGEFPSKITLRTLDTAQKHGLKVIAGFWVEDVDFSNPINCNDLIKRFGDYVAAFKDHKAILFWALGNENNYRLNPNTNTNLKNWYSLANEMAQKAHDIEGANYHPVAIVNGETSPIGASASNAADNQLPAIDIWGINLYRGQSFGNLFTDLSAKTKKCIWVSEFGVDAWYSITSSNPADGREDQSTQSQWLEALWGEMKAKVNIGGSVMEYSDEWWKPNEWSCGTSSLTCNSRHDYTAIPLTAFPDHLANEEWFGIVAISPSASFKGPDVITPRLAYFALQQAWSPLPSVIVTTLTVRSMGTSFGIYKGDALRVDLTLTNNGPIATPATTVDICLGNAVAAAIPRANPQGATLKPHSESSCLIVTVPTIDVGKQWSWTNAGAWTINTHPSADQSAVINALILKIDPDHKFKNPSALQGQVLYYQLLPKPNVFHARIS